MADNDTDDEDETTANDDEVDNDSVLSELAVFEENYALLCNTVSDVIDPLMKYLVEENLCTNEETEEIVDINAATEKLQLLLLKISSLLKANNTRGFYTMLKVMKQQGGKGTQTLADHIMNRLKFSADSMPDICSDDQDIIPSASEPNELTIFKENYASLCNTITDINELLKYFVAEKIITMNQQEEITACITRSERVSKLLLNISGPLEAGNSKGFYTMLKIMKTHGVDATQCLASHIVAKVENLKSYQQVDTRIMPLGWTQEEIKHFDNHIRHLYTKSTYLVDDQSWPPFTPNKFVSLLMIRHLEIHLQVDKQVPAVINSIKTAECLKINNEQNFTTNDISEIFQHGEKIEAHNKLILILGVPGIGKTILSKEIAYQWADNKLLSEKEIVLMLFLRDPNIKNIKQLKDLVHYFYEFSENAVEISTMCSNYIFQMGGSNVTIILDGLDEIPIEVIDNTYIKLLLDRKALPCCT